MGLVLVCVHRQAKKPFRAEKTGVGLYSLEELSYYLYHNLYLVEPGFFDERLCRWIEEELEDPELAGRLKGKLASRTGLEGLVTLLVSASGLYTDQEVEKLSGRLAALGAMQEQERLKLRADELLDGGKDRLAMEEYRHILAMHQNSRLGMDFYASVWNNLGVCLARQFLFSRAADCFRTAGEYQADEEYARQEKLARSLAAGELPPSPPPDDEEARDPKERLLAWEREYRSRMG